MIHQKKSYFIKLKCTFCEINISLIFPIEFNLTLSFPCQYYYHRKPWSLQLYHEILPFTQRLP